MKKAISGTSVNFTFDGLEGISFDATRASAANRAYAEMHGWMARLGDAAALSRKQPDGTIVTITEAMRRAEIESLVAHYYSGDVDWNMKARPVAKDPMVQALADKRGISYEQQLAENQAELRAMMQAKLDAIA